MSKKRKLLEKALQGARNMAFDDAVALAEAFGFTLRRVTGSHHIFSHPEVAELVNLQNVHGQAKPYQVHQLLKLVEKYALTLREDER